VADQLPPAFTHLAQPARGESRESTLSRVRTVAANLTVVLL